MSSVPSPNNVEALAPFDYHPLNRVVFGSGTLPRVGELTRELGGKKVLLVTDRGLEQAGHPQRADKSLREAGLNVILFDDVDENPTTKHVRLGLECAKNHAVDFIVAVGGGSAMDCAKGINFLYTNGGAIADYKGFGKATKPMLPSICVPTTAGTGSESQSYALIADEKSHIKAACGDRKAAFRVAILDPEVTLTQPTRVAALTGIDAMAHAIESYVCTRRNPLSQSFARSAWRLLNPALERVLKHPDDLEARGSVQLGANLAGTAIENSMLGVCHAMSNPLTAHYGITHGLAIGILLPHVIKFNAPVVGSLYADFVHDGVQRNGDANLCAELLAQRIQEMMMLADVPTRLSDCGVSQTIFPILAEEAGEQWTGKFNPRPASEDDIIAIYEAAL